MKGEIIPIYTTKKEDKELIKKASRKEFRSVSSFVLKSAIDKAHEVLKNGEVGIQKEA